MIKYLQIQLNCDTIYLEDATILSMDLHCFDFFGCEPIGLFRFEISTFYISMQLF